MDTHKGVLVCGEIAEGKLAPVTIELLGLGRKLANELGEAGYRPAEIDALKAEVDHYEKVRTEVKLASSDYIDLKMFEPAMRHLIDTYIRAEESKKISAFDDMPLIQLIVERGAEAVEALPQGIRKNQEAVAETIENNVRRLIIDEQPINPKYYEKMSELLDALIEQRQQGLQRDIAAHCLARVVDEGRNRAHRRRPLHRHPAAGPGDDGKTRVVDEVADRPQRPGEDLRAGGGLAQLDVDLAEFFNDGLLAHVSLDHVLPGDRLLDDAIQIAEILLLLAETLARCWAARMARSAIWSCAGVGVGLAIGLFSCDGAVLVSCARSKATGPCPLLAVFSDWRVLPPPVVLRGSFLAILCSVTKYSHDSTRRCCRHVTKHVAYEQPASIVQEKSARWDPLFRANTLQRGIRAPMIRRTVREQIAHGFLCQGYRHEKAA